MIKEEFAKWLLENAPTSYGSYLGKTISSVSNKLSEINNFFEEKDIFDVNKDNYLSLIEYLQQKNRKENRLKNKNFYEYDKKKGNGRPIAILGKENYIKFLNGFDFKSGSYIMNLNNALQPFIKQYREIITSSEDYDEIYKWEAIQNFQNNWNLEADDFVSMLEASFPGNENLWAGSHFLPISMLKEFGLIKRDVVVEALKNLFDEDNSIENRIPEYISVMDSLLNDYNRVSGRKDKSHYQDARAISILLSFQYPSKHSMFKHSVLKTFCEKFKLEAPKTGRIVEQILVNNQINRLVKEVITKDHQLMHLHQNRLTTNSFRQDDNNILTQDFIYSVFAYGTKTTQYYLGGAYWSNEKPPSQIDRFIEESIWVNGYEDKFSELVNSIPVGSKIALKTTHKKKNILEIFNIGAVLKNYQNGQKLDVEWESDFKSFKLPFAGGYWDTITEVTDIEHIEQIFSHESEHMKRSLSESIVVDKDIPLNQIFFGPPGTGKTFNTVNHALNICGVKTKNSERDELKSLYDQKIEEGQIIFTTFHQSMSYEDFIEGIKPIEPEKDGEPVTYKVVEGIFKKACIEASFNFAMENETDKTDNVLDFSLAYDNFIQHLEERLASESHVELEIKNGGKVYVDSISVQGNIQIKHLNGLRTYTVSKTRLSKLQKSITDLEEVTNINDTFRSIIGGSNSSAYWSVLNAILKGNGLKLETSKLDRKYTWEDKKEVVQSLSRSVFKGKTGKPIVLIIDEINRGNVSAIFGELITLIEKDKRLGADEALLAQLPYSKEYFGVPPNLYIIGTMNTADRSVEAIDSALRRRFSFTEMPTIPELLSPQRMVWSLLWKYPDLGWKEEPYLRKERSLFDLIEPDESFLKDCVSLWDLWKKEGQNENQIFSLNKYKYTGINLEILLRTINKRIEKLLDKDHTIGHSYFLKIKSMKGLKTVFANKVIPLLQEYFFGDYGKIGLVLGSGFFEPLNETTDEKFFAPFDGYDLGTLLERKVYKMKNALEMKDEQFKAALLQLLR